MIDLNKNLIGIVSIFKKLFAWGKIRRVILDATPFQLYEIYVTNYRIFHTVNSEKTDKFFTGV